jgi:hypothetical protein
MTVNITALRKMGKKIVIGKKMTIHVKHLKNLINELRRLKHNI